MRKGCYFILGFLLSITLLFYIESDYETRLFNSIAANILKDSVARNSQDSFFAKAMATTNFLVLNRTLVFGGRDIGGFKANYIHAATVDLMTGTGACGSASIVLARILKANNYKVRIAQMKVHEQWAGHMVIEVKKHGSWIVLDPLLNVYFKRTDGEFASFDEVSENWKYFVRQLPVGYPMQYCYQDVRYTNWSRLGKFELITKKVLIYFFGVDFVEDFCVRSYFLRVYNILFWISFILFVACLFSCIGFYLIKLK